MSAIDATFVELRSRPVPELLERSLLGQRAPVRTGRRHGVERVGDVDDRRFHQPVAADGGGCRFGGRVAGDGREEVDATEQLDRHELVTLHTLELRRGEAAGLVEELIRHDELADVVHQGGVTESFHAAGAEASALHPRTPRTSPHAGRAQPCTDPSPREQGSKSRSSAPAPPSAPRSSRTFALATKIGHCEERHYRSTEMDVHPADAQARTSENGKARRSIDEKLSAASRGTGRLA